MIKEFYFEFSIKYKNKSYIFTCDSDFGFRGRIYRVVGFDVSKDKIYIRGISELHNKYIRLPVFMCNSIFYDDVSDLFILVVSNKFSDDLFITNLVN